MVKMGYTNFATHISVCKKNYRVNNILIQPRVACIREHFYFTSNLLRMPFFQTKQKHTHFQMFNKPVLQLLFTFVHLKVNEKLN